MGVSKANGEKRGHVAGKEGMLAVLALLKHLRHFLFSFC